MISPRLRLASILVTVCAVGKLAYAQPPSPSSDGLAVDRLAVIILSAPGTERALADNLTEVAIERLANLRPGELAGADEFRRSLGLGDDRRAFACIGDAACLGRAGVALGVRRVVTGAVRSEAGHYLVDLSLTDIERGHVDARFFRLVNGDVDELITAIRDGIAELFQQREEPGRVRVETALGRARVSIDDLYIGSTPVISQTLLPGPHDVRVEQERRFPWHSVVTVKPAAVLQIRVSPEMMPARRSWPTLVATGGFVAAGAAALAAGTVGTLASLEPASGSRRDIQADLERRRDLATAANVLFVTSAVLATTSAVLLIRYWRDVFGE
jgi:TolB-like protein